MRSLLAAIVLTLTVVACAPDAPAPSTPDPHPLLAGTSWRLVSMGGQPMPDRPPLTIEFDDGRLSGEGPCNQIRGSLRYDRGSGAIEFGDVVLTKRACLNPALGRLEAAFVSAIGASTAIGLDDDGGLILTGSGVDLRFAEIARAIPAGPTPPPP